MALLAVLSLATAGGHAQANVDCLAFTRVAAPDPYVPGSNLVVTVTFTSTCSESISALGIVETIPAGWIYISAGGQSPPDTRPGVGEGGDLEFAWISGQTYPFSFTYTIRPPAGATGDQEINGTAEYRVASAGAQFAGPVITPLSDGIVECLDQPGCVTLSRSTPAATYLPGAGLQVTLTVTEACTSELVALSVTETVPAGWRFADATGEDAPTLQPEPGATGTLTFGWLEVPALPVTFTYTLAVPGTAVGQQQLTGNVTWRTCDDDLAGAAVTTTLDQGDSALAQCTAECVDAPATDTDSDGLGDCVETCLGTNPEKTDTDTDGIPDGVEAVNGLNPVDLSDAAGDLDIDGDDNLREYLNGSSIADASDPAPVFFLDAAGVDDPSGGGVDQPWRSIAFALDEIDAKGLSAAKLLLGEGLYVESVNLIPGVSLIGLERCDEEDFTGCAAIVGPMTGAEGASLRNLLLTVNVSEPEAALLTLDDVAMDIENVVFIGTTDRLNTGLRVLGEGPGLGNVASSRFEQLDVGIEVNGCHPRVFGSDFLNHQTAYFVFNDAGVPPCGGSLGRENDGSTGWNRFFATTGLTIINNNPEEIVMQRNDWDTDSDAFIAAQIDGNIKYRPFLEAGSALLAGSLFCSVWNAADLVPIENATVSLGSTSIAEVTSNNKGVYAFNVISEGSYTIRVSAPGFRSQTMPVFLDRGGILSANFALEAGDDPVTPPPPGGCQCPGPAKGVPLGGDAGSLLIGALTMLAISLSTFLTRRPG
ncbi:MAG: hypothetical protein RLZZ303_1822 [Candidatus Hydrogenedentota bacterium]